MKTVLKAIQEHPDLELKLVVAASALLDRYGSAVNYIEKDGFAIAAKVFNVLEGENLTAAAKTTGIGILELYIRGSIRNNLFVFLFLFIQLLYMLLFNYITGLYICKDNINFTPVGRFLIVLVYVKLPLGVI